MHGNERPMTQTTLDPTRMEISHGSYMPCELAFNDFVLGSCDHRPARVPQRQPRRQLHVARRVLQQHDCRALGDMEVNLGDDHPLSNHALDHHSDSSTGFLPDFSRSSNFSLQTGGIKHHPGSSPPPRHNSWCHIGNVELFAEIDEFGQTSRMKTTW